MPIPTICPSGYVMDFYCRFQNDEHPFQPGMGGGFMDTPTEVETRGEAIAVMRRRGWIYHRDGTATCPICNPKGLTA